MTIDVLDDLTDAVGQAWGYGGADWEAISFGLSDGIGHAVQALWPKPGERVLDIGTGTGRAAREVALLGPTVTGLDPAKALLDAARALSSHLPAPPKFLVGTAEALPFEDASFDAVISTYGIIFAADPDRALAEVARVLRPGGRLILLTWEDVSDGYIPEFFALVSSYADGPPPPGAPFAWGNRDWLSENLGEAFRITTEKRSTTLYAPSAEEVWDKYIAGFGPMRLVAEALTDTRLSSFRRNFIELHARYKTDAGLRIDRQALLVRGIRR